MDPSHNSSILAKCKIRSNSEFSTLVAGVSEAFTDRVLVFFAKEGYFT